MADPLGKVYQGVEGTGSAVVYQPWINPEQTLLKQQEVLYQQQQRKREEQKKKANQKMPTLEYTGWIQDTDPLQKGYGYALNTAWKDMMEVGDITPQTQQVMQSFLNTANASKEQEKQYNDAYKWATQNLDKIDADKYFQELEAWKSIPMMERLTTPMPVPDAVPEEEKIDLTKPLGSLVIGYSDVTEYFPDKAEGGLIPGTKTKTPKSSDLYKQAENLADLYPDVYKAGLNADEPLWSNKKEMGDYYAAMKLGQATTTVEEVIRNQPKTNMFGTGRSEQEIDAMFNEWWTDFQSGNVEAANFLKGTNDLTNPKQKFGQAKVLNVIDAYDLGDLTVGDIRQPKTGLKPSQVKVFDQVRLSIEEAYPNIDPNTKLSDIAIYEYETTQPGYGWVSEGGEDGKSILKPTSVAGSIYITPQSLTKEEGKKMFIQGLKGGSVYNRDVNVTTGGKPVPEQKPTEVIELEEDFWK